MSYLDNAETFKHIVQRHAQKGVRLRLERLEQGEKH